MTHLPQLEKPSVPEWLEEKLKLVEAQKAKHTPKWWLEWLALNQPESKIESKSGDKNAKTTPPPKDKVAN
jgi:hypothetical protein